MMLSTDEIRSKFDSLGDYERFRINWTRCCARLNHEGKNAVLLEASEKRAKAVGITQEDMEDGIVRAV